MKCSICDCEFDLDGEGGISGDIGILPVAFCPFCYSGILDLAEQIMCEGCEYKFKCEEECKEEE